MNDNNPSDWRAALVQGVHQVFQHERELYLQELRTFVAAQGSLQPTEVERLESRLKSLVSSLSEEQGYDLESALYSWGEIGCFLGTSV